MAQINQASVKRVEIRREELERALRSFDASVDDARGADYGAVMVHIDAQRVVSVAVQLLEEAVELSTRRQVGFGRPRKSPSTRDGA